MASDNHTSETTTKRCTKCGETKSANDFYPNKGRYDGMSVYCRPCMNSANSKYRSKTQHKPENEIATFKTCQHCKKRKKSADFSKNKGSADGLYSFCKACVREINQEWKRNNRSRHDEYNRTYRLSPKGRLVSVIATAKYKSRKSNLPDTLSEEEWLQAMQYWNGRCCYCGNLPGFWNPLCIEHFIPVSKGGSFAKDNILPGCKSCNSSKSNNEVEHWLTKKFGKRKAKQVLKRIQDYFDSLI